MKHYIWNGETYDQLPNPLKTEDGSMISPVTEEQFQRLGGVIEEDGEPTPEEKFAEAALMFCNLCNQIGEFIGDPSFQGGFDEYSEFASSAAYQQNPVQGNAFAIQWSALNELCKYKGSLIGLGQPDWWYEAWRIYADSQEAEQAAE